MPEDASVTPPLCCAVLLLSMSKQRVVKDEIWDDDWFYDLDPSEKLVWIFLLTNPRGNIVGIYKVNVRWVANLTGFDKDVVTNVLKRFVKDGKILWEKDWIGLVNFHKHIPYSNPNMTKGTLRLCKELKGYTNPLKGFESLWVTLLNSTLLNLSDSEQSSQIIKEIKTELMAWKKYNENEHSDDIPSIGDDGDIETPKPKVKRNYKPVYSLFEEILGKQPNNWLVNKTQQQCAENLFTERGIGAIKNALYWYIDHKEEEFCPRISSPSDLDSKWTKLAEFKQKYGN